MQALIKKERQEDGECETEYSVSIEKPLSLEKEDITNTLSSKESDFEQTHSITSIKKQSKRASPSTHRDYKSPSVESVSAQNKRHYRQERKTLGPYQVGYFIKITNQFKVAQGTIGEVISDQEIYNTILDMFGNRHKQEHHNLSTTLDKRY